VAFIAESWREIPCHPTDVNDLGEDAHDGIKCGGCPSGTGGGTIVWIIVAWIIDVSFNSIGSLGNDMRSLVTLGLAAVTASALAFAALGAPDMTGTIKTRQDHMKSNGAATKAIADELKKSDPSLKIIQDSTKMLSDNVPMISPAAFPAGSGAESGVKTAALPAIWEKPADFKTAYDNYSAEEKKFAGVVAQGDVAAIKTEFADLGKACGACHRTFRMKQE
jgi:cytochrome c556